MRYARLIPPTPEHVDLVAAGMRQADRDEIWASHRWSPHRALEDGVRNSTYSWAAEIDGEVVCLFGVAPRSILTGTGTPWMLGTGGVVRHGRKFLADCRECLDEAQSVYPTLVNYVDDRNTVSKRWLRWMGFKLDDPEPYGVEKLPFRRFELGVN